MAFPAQFKKKKAAGPIHLMHAAKKAAGGNKFTKLKKKGKPGSPLADRLTNLKRGGQLKRSKPF